MPPSIAMAIGHPVLGDRVHGGADDRRVQRDVARESASHAGVAGEDLRILRDEQDVVESQSQQRLTQDRPGYLVRSPARPICVVAISPPPLLRSLARSTLPADPRLEAGAFVPDILRIEAAPRPTGPPGGVDRRRPLPGTCARSELAVG